LPREALAPQDHRSCEMRARRRPHGRGSFWDGGVPESHIPSVDRPREVLRSSEMVPPDAWHGI